MIGEADYKDWTPLRKKQTLIHVVIKQFCTSVPFCLVMQQDIGYLWQTINVLFWRRLLILAGVGTAPDCE